MTRPAIDLRNNQYDVSIQKYASNPIIDGYFPTYKTYKEMAITRVNRTLCALLIIFILVAGVSYYFVTANELTLNKYRKQTLALNDENVELQNKLDYLRSYYNVDKAMQQKNLLHKPKNVIEIKQSTANGSNKVASSTQSEKPIKWSLGY